MSDTPRTQNAFAIANLHDNKRMKAIYDEMSQLERELAVARQQRDALINILTDVINEDGSAKSIDRASLFLTAVKGGSHE